MSHRKFQADYLFTGHEILEGNWVLVTDMDGTVRNIVPAADAGEEGTELYSGLLCPGLINCHCHLELSHLKGVVPEKTGLVDFVLKVMSSRFTSSEDQILSAISKAEDQMYKSGIVAVGDICNSGITLSLKKRSSLTFYNFIEVSGWLPKVAEIRFAQGQALLDQFTDLLTAPCQSSICPHAPYSVSEGLWERITPLFAQATSVTMHSQETSGENEWFLRGTGDLARLYQLMGLDYSFFAPSGRSSLQTCLRRFQTARRLILVHNTFISEDDLRYLASHRPQEDATFLCLCVNANEYITGKVPPVPLMRASEFRIVLGTDSLASNHTLDLLAEIKTVLRHFPLIPQTEILKWATINGAMALALDNQFGSFEAGKCPGVALLDQILDGRLTQATTARRIL